MEDAWRKHHTSSVTREIWKYDASTGRHTNLTNHAGEDRSPVLSADSRTVYILSERNGGSMNVYQFPIDQPSAIKAVTSFKTHPVRFLSIAGDGTLCYTYDGEIYTQAPQGKPSKVKVSLFHDDSEDVLRTSMTKGATAAVASPDHQANHHHPRGRGRTLVGQRQPHSLLRHRAQWQLAACQGFH